MKPLFQLSEDILALEAELERDDLSDEQRAALVDAWLETQGDVAAKLDNYAALIRELDARSETRAAEARRLVALANADAERMASLSARLKAYFERHNLKNFSTARYKLSLQRNGGKMPIVIEVEPERLPEEFHRVIPARIEADRDKLSIWFGPHLVADKGERAQSYVEKTVAAYMKGREIVIRADVGVGSASATVWTCDLTHDYVSINADYRS